MGCHRADFDPAAGAAAVGVSIARSRLPLTPSSAGRRLSADGNMRREKGRSRSLKLLLIRHAESVGNAERRLQGQGDFPLSERGREQAERLAARLAERERPVAMYASPLQRTLQTAEPAAARLGLRIEPLPDVREYDFGEVSGLTWTEVAERYPDLIAAVRSRTADYPTYPGEEGRENFRNRVCGAIWSLCDQHEPDVAVAVVTHAGPIVVTCLEVLGLPYQRPAAFDVDNCSITTVHLQPQGSVLLSANDTCHLQVGGRWT